MQDTILIVDDEKDLLSGLQRIVAMETGCKVLTAGGGPAALAVMAKESVDLVLTDLSMPDMNGMELLSAIMASDPHVTVVLMTAYGTIETAVTAIKQGAYDFIQKPFEEEPLIRLLTKGLERNRLVRENARLARKVGECEPFEKMVGRSAPMGKVFETIRMLGRTHVTALILGETGTGKDLVAQAIHAVSNRRHKPLVTVNCPALPEGLLENELFGHKRGAFTNATEDKRGAFDQADGGSIFLDEIGDLPLSLQTKLLRVLQNREVKPLGEDRSHSIDVRVIAATNQDLLGKIERGQFRADLFYRLNVASVTLPSLKEIGEDIPLLVEHFLKKGACELSVPAKRLSPEVMAHLSARKWPGNIRELENTIQGWIAMTPGSTITADDINIGGQTAETAPETAQEGADLSRPYKELKDQVLERFSVQYLTSLLSASEGNVTLAAGKSGIQRQSLQKIIKRYGIDPESFRAKS